MKAVAPTHYLPITDPNSLIDVELRTPTPTGRNILVAVQAIAVNPVDVELAFSPPVSAISGACGSSFARHRPVDNLRHLGRAGEADPRNARVRGQRRAHGRSVTGQKLYCCRPAPPPRASAPPRGPRSAGSARRVSRPPRSQRPAPPRSGRRRSPAGNSTG